MSVRAIMSVHGRGFGSKSGGGRSLSHKYLQLYVASPPPPPLIASPPAPLTSRILLSPFNLLYFHLFLSFFYLFWRVKCDLYRLLYPLIPAPSKLYLVLFNTFKYKYILSWNQPKFSFLLIVAGPISLKPYSYLWCGYIDNAWHGERFNIPNQ